MITEIYYFSGTGNSLHAAKEMSKRMQGAVLVPVVAALKKSSIETAGEVIGIVAPIHAFSLPLPVLEFIKKADFRSAKYVFILTTRFCMPGVHNAIDRMLKKKGITLNACFYVQMAENYLPYFDVDSDEEIRKADSELENKLDFIRQTVDSGKSYREKLSTGSVIYLMIKVLSPVVTFVFQKTRYFGLEKSFYADANCSGCGICEKVCLSGKISLSENKPVWKRNVKCTFCLACIHYCPEKAIQIKGTKTTWRGRYHHPKISIDDIAAQKRQV